MARLLKRLDNPFLLTAQGFVLGAILFWATLPSHVEAKPNHAAASAQAPAAPARL
jgi:hypothetical protein